MCFHGRFYQRVFDTIPRKTVVFNLDEDITDMFTGIGTLKLINIMHQITRLVALLVDMCESWDVYKELMDAFDSFTCCMNERPHFNQVDNSMHHLLMRVVTPY